MFFARAAVIAAFASSAVSAAPVHFAANGRAEPLAETATDADQGFMPRRHERLEFRGQQSHTGGGGNSK
jgi:hypothetical protein